MSKRQTAVLFGVSNYSGQTSDLPAVENDLREMAGLLASQSGRFNGGDVVVLADQECTKARVEQEFRKACRAATAEEPLFLYFAGHGALLNDESYFVPWDGEQAGLLPLSEIRSAFESSKSEAAFLFLDICHAGGIVGRSEGASSIDVDAVRESLARELVVSQGSGKVIMAACTGEQTAYESAGHGHFTRLLLEGLKGEAVNSFHKVTANSLHDFLCEKISGQTPVFHTNVAGSIHLIHFDAGTTPQQPSTNTAGRTVSTSGNLVLFGDDLVVPCADVTTYGDGRWHLQVDNPDTQTSAKLKRLTQLGGHSHRGRRELELTHENSRAFLSVDRSQSSIQGGGKRWSIALTPTNQRQNRPGLDASYQTDTKLYTPEDIAEAQARTILLRESPPIVAGHMGSAIFPNTTRDGVPIAPPLHVLGDESSWRPETLQRFRLHLVRRLLAANVVTTIITLSLHPTSRELRVTFEGLRDNIYANREPELIVVEGDLDSSPP